MRTSINLLVAEKFFLLLRWKATDQMIKQDETVGKTTLNEPWQTGSKQGSPFRKWADR